MTLSLGPRPSFNTAPLRFSIARAAADALSNLTYATASAREMTGKIVGARACPVARPVADAPTYDLSSHHPHHMDLGRASQRKVDDRCTGRNEGPPPCTACPGHEVTAEGALSSQGTETQELTHTRIVQA